MPRSWAGAKVAERGAQPPLDFHARLEFLTTRRRCDVARGRIWTTCHRDTKGKPDVGGPSRPARSPVTSVEGIMALKDYLFTSESVSEGHPDKVCDQISDAILDAFIANDIKHGIA